MFVVRRCLDDDVEVVDNFFSSVVFKEEPFISINGPHVIPPVGESLSQAVIPQGHSLIAESPDGTVIGVCLNDEPPQIFPSIYTNSEDDIKDFFQYMEDVSEVVAKAPNAMELRLMAVEKSWRKKGVASALLKASEAAAHDGGFSNVKIYCTSSYSSNLVKKLGWEKMFSVSYKEYVENLNPHLKIPQAPHTHCDLYVKKIS